jgi:CDP-diacylglycerol--glycerol-3-phosphate 3-phosphatidyltransferase
MMPESTTIPPVTLTSLRRSWALFVFISAIFLVVGFTWLLLEWQAEAAWRWLGLAALTILYLAVILWRCLGQNRRSSDYILLPRLGWGNWMTLFRGILVAGVVGFLFSPRPPGYLAWVPALFFTLAIIGDVLDGYLARRANQVTLLGITLDMSFDSVGVLAAVLLLVQYEVVPPWYALVGLARYLYLAGGWLLQRMGRNLTPLPPSITRRMFASIQFTFIAVVLYPLFIPPLTWWAAIFFALPFLINFGRDFLLTGNFIRITPTPNQILRFLPAILIFLRIGLALLAVLALQQMLTTGMGRSWSGILLLAAQTLVVMMALAGFAGRISAGVALGLLGLSQWLFTPTMIQILQTAGYTAIVFMGTGPFSLWSPEEDWYRRPFGATQGPVT